MKKEKELRKFPRRTKFKKSFRGSMKLIKLNTINFVNQKNIFVIKTISAGFLKWKTLIEAQKNLKRFLKKKKNKVRILINANLNWPISRKPKGTRMGKGKGKVNFDDWVCRVPAGKFLIQLWHVSEVSAVKALRLAQTVLPLPSVLEKKY